jgi:hypothetical protein
VTVTGVLAGKVNIARFAPIEEFETQRFLLRVLNDPHNLAKHIRKYAAHFGMRIQLT